MTQLTIPARRLDERAILPRRASASAAGADLHALLEAPAVIAPGETLFIPTGLALEIPEGFAGFIFARSGLSCKSGLAPANKVGVVDADYRGEVTVALHNHSPEPRTVAPGERIAQLVILPVVMADYAEAEALSDTERGAGGFGSTGK